jgi:hypothetical protein
MKLVTVGALFACSLMAGGVAFAAGSKCDSGVTKAAGRKVACKTSVIAQSQLKGTQPDPAKLKACETKFAAACSKAKAAADCEEQTKLCSETETDADTCVRSIAMSSPSGAFLDAYDERF